MPTIKREISIAIEYEDRKYTINNKEVFHSFLIPNDIRMAIVNKNNINCCVEFMYDISILVNNNNYEIDELTYSYTWINGKESKKFMTFAYDLLNHFETIVDIEGELLQ